jgi:hypothetical protein
MGRLLFVVLFLFSTSVCAEENSSQWTPVLGETISMLIQVVGSALIILVSALVWKLLGKFGIEKNIAADVLLRSKIKEVINYSEAYAEKLANKPTGENKMATAVKYVIDAISKSKLPAMAEDKLKEMIEAQLAHDKKN